jgi:hypothetical protein
MNTPKVVSSIRLIKYQTHGLSCSITLNPIAIIRFMMCANDAEKPYFEISRKNTNQLL